MARTMRNPNSKESEMAPGERPKLLLVTEDSFAAVVRAFMSPANPRWTLPPPDGYAEATKDAWGRELKLAAHPEALGAVSLQSIRPALVQAFLDGLAGRPGKQANALAALKQLEKWAVVRDILPRQITTGVETGKPRGGHIPWSDEQVALAEKYARKDIAKAITLAGNTGQRGSDLIRIAPTDYEIYSGMAGLNVTQKKTKRQIWIPITSPLAAAMETWERRPGPYLRRPDGDVWTRQQLTDAWSYERDTNPALAPLRSIGSDGRPLVMHGLRGTACVRLKRAGATTAQIADMVGMSEEMVARYCRFSLQKENAVAAVYNLERTIRERNIDMSKGSGS
jgi:integrase